METTAMVDSGATALFLDQLFVDQHKISTFPLRSPIRITNIDGSPNRAGNISHFARLRL
ncbi:hypothetical protein CONPUDRAFT_25325, partial [Coniophora puteana RWD-64-598 SS2]